MEKYGKINYFGQWMPFFRPRGAVKKKNSLFKDIVQIELDPLPPTLIFKAGNGIIQIGNGIIYRTSRPLIKKLILQNVSYLFQGIQNWFSKQEMELSKQEMELFLPLPGLWSKNFFYKMFFISSNGFIINFQNRK